MSKNNRQENRAYIKARYKTTVSASNVLTRNIESAKTF